MNSNSSLSSIQQRVENQCTSENLIDHLDDFSVLFVFFSKQLQYEFEQIPAKERIGKGGLFIGRGIAGGFDNFLTKLDAFESFDYLKFSESLFNYGIQNGLDLVQYSAICLMTKWIEKKENNFQKSIPILENWADNENWAIRETVIDPIVGALSKYPEEIFGLMEKWVKSPNENLRRIAIEGIRPKAQIKWLRKTESNDKVFYLLGIARKDASEYVRKSVGNNLKDLSKYMPEKVLNCALNWIKEANINVTDDLASKNKAELGTSNFYLVWTLKQALRWLKDRNPEYYPRIEEILGKNYVLYFDEKKNWSSKII